MHHYISILQWCMPRLAARAWFLPRTDIMISHMYYLHKLEKRFDELERTCIQGRKAVEQAKNLVHEMKEGVDHRAHIKQTKHGELRIKNCKKFDLGSGYRMVTVQQGTCIYLLYIGSHDDCHHWIENHRGYLPDSGDCKDVYLVPRPEKVSAPERPEPPECDYEDLLMQKIDDRLLRSIFSGLCCPAP